MNAQPKPGEIGAVSQMLPQRSALLRFIACGSVDHGKSTLIGRLLYESKQLYDDQLDALTVESRKFGTQGDDLDFSLLLDGLAAEREQKITIDVAYRFFSTARRKFIVIDAPGHEQYTANMATGASVADLALVLVDASEGLTRQTKRHVMLLAMLGIGDIVLAVNKMDRVDWSQDAFRAIERQFREFGTGLGVANIVCIPVAAKSGDNIVTRSSRMHWYRGAPLLEFLEEVEPRRASCTGAFRMPIQLVARPNSDFRGYSGLITSGAVHVGMPVMLIPSKRISRIARIVTFDGDLVHAVCGRSVTLTLADDVDASRGDLVVGVERAPGVGDSLTARLFWMSRKPLKPGQSYSLKLATTTATATIQPGLRVIDLDTGKLADTDAIAPNVIGSCTLKLDRAVGADRYASHKDTGSFLLIDPETFDTVGMGCIEQVASSVPAVMDQRAAGKTGRLGGKLSRWSDTHARSLAKAVSWRATGSIDTFVLTLVISGSSKLAGSVAATEIFTKILIYYGHERIWSWVPWGKRVENSSRPAPITS